jgi:SAM-dependent methyltransferase
MPTVPSSGPEQHQPARSHIAAEVAESFGRNAERYDRARPRYPEALVERIVAAAPGPEVLDVGCGTGIFARQLHTAGAHVRGLDADERMAELARHSGLDVDVSTFETWDPAHRRFDAVTAAQAWHWIDPVAGAAKAAEALRPGGLLALIWNAAQLPADIATAFTQVYRQVLPGSPIVAQSERLAGIPAAEGYRTLGGKGVDGMRESGAFADAEEWRYDWEWVYTRDAWLDVVPTQGGHNLLEPAQLNDLLAGFGAVIDASGGAFTMQYTTLAFVAARSER